MTATARQETGVTVDWQHVAKQCGDALDQSGQMVTIHRGALSLALVAVQQLATPTPPRDDAGVEDVEELLSDLARAAEDGQNSYERGDRLGQREAGNREDEARDAILAIVRTARQRIAALERAAVDYLDCHDTGSIEAEGQALDALRAVLSTPTPTAPDGAVGGERNLVGHKLNCPWVSFPDRSCTCGKFEQSTPTGAPTDAR